MDDLGEDLRNLWRSLFRLPGRTTAEEPRTRTDIVAWAGAPIGGEDGGWLGFALLWLWAIVGAIPGALAAAYIIGRFHITDQRLQDGVSVALAFMSMLLIQAIVFLASSGSVNLLLALLSGHRLQKLEDRARKIVEASEQDVTADKQELVEEARQLFRRPLKASVIAVALLFLVIPLALAGGAVYWYFTHGSASADVAARGTGGALALKVLLTLINVVVWPAIKAVFLKVLWQWVRGGSTRTSKPDESA